jgi:hypothetical protein
MFGSEKLFLGGRSKVIRNYGISTLLEVEAADGFFAKNNRLNNC